MPFGKDGGQYYVQTPETCDPRINLFAEKGIRAPAGCPFTYMNTLTMVNPYPHGSGTTMD